MGILFKLHFFDGELIEAESEGIDLARKGFNVTPISGNNKKAWVPREAVKYVEYLSGMQEAAPDFDPRDGQALDKIILRFTDNTILRTYRDDSFSVDGEGITARIWDADTQTLKRILIPSHSLKAFFTVDKWNSNVEESEEVSSPEET